MNGNSAPAQEAEEVILSLVQEGELVEPQPPKPKRGRPRKNPPTNQDHAQTREGKSLSTVPMPPNIGNDIVMVDGFDEGYADQSLMSKLTLNKDTQGTTSAYLPSLTKSASQPTPKDPNMTSSQPSSTVHSRVAVQPSVTGLTRNDDQHGLMVNLDGQWSRAIYHHEYVKLLPQDEIDRKHYAIAPGRGNLPEDITSFLKEHQFWGRNREDRPPIMFEYEKRDRPTSTQPPRRLVHTSQGNQRIVIDVVTGTPLRNFANIPIQISTKVEGWRMLAIMREDDSIGFQDFRERMPRLLKIDGFDGRPQKHTLQDRSKVARDLYRCLPWKQGDRMNSAFNQVLKSQMRPEWIEANTTWPLEDLTKEDRAAIIEGRYQLGPTDPGTRMIEQSRHGSRDFLAQSSGSNGQPHPPFYQPANSGQFPLAQDQVAPAVLAQSPSDRRLQMHPQQFAFPPSNKRSRDEESGQQNPPLKRYKGLLSQPTADPPRLGENISLEVPATAHTVADCPLEEAHHGSGHDTRYLQRIAIAALHQGQIQQSRPMNHALNAPAARYLQPYPESNTQRSLSHANAAAPNHPQFEASNSIEQENITTTSEEPQQGARRTAAFAYPDPTNLGLDGVQEEDCSEQGEVLPSYAEQEADIRANEWSWKAQPIALDYIRWTDLQWNRFGYRGRGFWT